MFKEPGLLHALLLVLVVGALYALRKRLPGTQLGRSRDQFESPQARRRRRQLIALGFLDPGQTVVHQYRLPKGVAVGTYRLAMPMPVPEEDAGPEPELQTPAFKVYASSD